MGTPCNSAAVLAYDPGRAGTVQSQACSVRGSVMQRLVVFGPGWIRSGSADWEVLLTLVSSSVDEFSW